MAVKVKLPSWYNPQKHYMIRNIQRMVFYIKDKTSDKVLKFGKLKEL